MDAKGIQYDLITDLCPQTSMVAEEYRVSPEEWQRRRINAEEEEMLLREEINKLRKEAVEDDRAVSVFI